MYITERGLTMKLLISQALFQILQIVALKVGLNHSVILHQLHSKSHISLNIQEGHKWFCKTYEEWKNEEFPFWSIDTIKRTIIKL